MLPPPPPLPSPPPPPPPPPLPPHLSASRLPLPLPPGRPPPTSLLLAPPSSPSRALALLFSDFSACLIPSLPASGAAALTAAVAVPAPLAVAACFALLLPSSHLLFLSAHPSPSSPALHLRAYSLHASGRFAPAPLSFKRHVSTSGLPLQGLQFGLGVRLAGGVNAVAVLSMAAGQIWVLAPRLAADGRTVELHKCAVIELDPTRPVYAMEVALGRLLLGEVGGVRVFPLRGLVKGGKERDGRKEGAGTAGKKGLYKKNGILNGLVVPIGRNISAGGGERDALSTYKLTTLRIKQTSGSYCSFFLAFNYEDLNSQGGVESIKLVKAVSIYPLCKDKFLVLDSSGVLHVFGLPNTEMTKEASSKKYCEKFYTYRLDYAMKVQLFAAFPNSSTKTQIFWVSDGGHSIHIMSAFDVEAPKTDERDRVSANIKLSAIEAIFTSEKVQDIVPISKDSVLVLGQGNMFLYGTA